MDTTPRSRNRAVGESSPARRCPCRKVSGLLSAALQHAGLRFWLPKPRKFAHVGVDFHPAQSAFALWCLRRNERRELEIVNAVPNRFRLRELEATLVELNLAMPAALRQFFLAALGEDEAEVAARRSAIAPFMCACNADRGAVFAQPFAA